MFTYDRIVIFVGVVMACSTCTTAFFLGWGSSSDTASDQRQIQAYPVTTYYQRLSQAPPLPVHLANNDNPQNIPVQIPAIPIQVPLQASLMPTSNVHNVQLVPCLCPVSPELEYEKSLEGSVFVNHLKNSQQ